MLDTNKEVMVLRVPETVLEGTIAEKKPGVEGGWQVVATTEDMAETYDGEIRTVEETGDDRVYRCEMGFD